LQVKDFKITEISNQ